MSEMTIYCCPNCGMEVHDPLVDGRQFDCANCRRRFRVLMDRSTGRIGLFPMEPLAFQEPLGLPKGSIRAIATLATAGCSWGLMLADAPVPGYVLTLLLTIIGYYFGFRQEVRGESGRVLDAATKAPEPLGLPGGTIRIMLIVGFAVSSLVLYTRGRLGAPAYVEFFLILAGLIAGYFFSRLLAGNTRGRTVTLINHAKGLIVLVATVRLAILLLGGGQSDHPRLGLILACVISFYFGSRS